MPLPKLSPVGKYLLEIRSHPETVQKINDLERNMYSDGILVILRIAWKGKVCQALGLFCNINY